MSSKPLQNEQNLPNATNVTDPKELEALDTQVVLPSGPVDEEEFYTYEDDLEDGVAPQVAPFGVSQELSIAWDGKQSSEQIGTPAKPLAPRPSAKRPSLMLIAIIVCVVVVLGFLVLSALAQPNPPMRASTNPPAQVNQPTTTHGPAPTQGPANPQSGNGQAQGNGQTPGNGQTQGNTPNWVPNPLPAGWTTAGLSTSDGIESMRTAMTFTDREMSLDFRSAGTQNNHGGTFTAATFLLTPAGMQRFQQNDVRVINNTLWDKVQQEQLVQSVVNAQPQLVQFAQQGQQQFAWVDVSFQLFQSKVVGGQPMQGFDGNPATTHHMMVLLLRIQNAGANPPMGGTGWLVSVYALDLPTGMQPNIVTPA